MVFFFAFLQPMNFSTAEAPMPHLQLYGRDYAAKKRATTEAAFSDVADT